MKTWELILIAVGLAMDAFAVSICKGLSVGKLKARHSLITGREKNSDLLHDRMLLYICVGCVDCAVYGTILLLPGNSTRKRKECQQKYR